MKIEEILIIKNNSESFGISTQDINQIFRVPDVMPLPLRPVEVRGLSVLGGNISTVMDVNMLLGIGQVDIQNDKARLLSLTNENALNALLVSEVYTTITIDESNIEYVDRVDDAVVAIYKHKDMIVQIISLNALFSKIRKINIKSKDINELKVKDKVILEESSKRFLIFKMCSERFAIDIDFLKEIILSDITFTEITGSNKEIMGLITLRDNLITVIDLRTYYGFKETFNDKNRILITTVNSKTVGLLVDEIVDIKNFVDSKIEYMGAEFDKSKISGVLHDNNSLVSFLDDSVISDIIEANKAYIDTKEEVNEEKKSLDESIEVIIFKLDSREYAFEVEKVSEIIYSVKPTDVAMTESKIDGIINIRGQIVPIISLFKILGIEDKNNDNSKIIVTDINNSKVGFVVESVSDILRVNKNDIKPQEDDILTDVLHLEDGNKLIMMMNIEKMIQKEDVLNG